VSSWRPTCPSVLAYVVIVSPRAHQTHVSTLSGRGIGPYPASYAGITDGGVGRMIHVSCCLSTTGIRLLGLPAPAGGLGLPCGRLTRLEIPPGLHRDCHVPHERDATGEGALCTPGTAVHSRLATYPQSAPAVFQRPVPISRWSNPSAGVIVTRHHREFICIHPSGLPSL
jgi:hypothetical protein